MTGKTDKKKLANAIMTVGTGRITGVERGDTVNETGKTRNASTASMESPESTVESIGAKRLNDVHREATPVGVPPSVDPADARTERIGFLCSPRVKKHLKRRAIDLDTDVSSMIREALDAMGHLP